MPNFTQLQNNYLKKNPSDQKILNKLLRLYGVEKLSSILKRAENKKGKIILNTYKQSGFIYFIVSQDGKATLHNIKRLDEFYVVFKNFYKYWDEFLAEVTLMDEKELDALNCTLFGLNISDVAEKYNMSNQSLKQIAYNAKDLLSNSVRKEFYDYWVKYNIKQKVLKPKDFITDYNTFSSTLKGSNEETKIGSLPQDLNYKNVFPEDRIGILLSRYKKENVCKILFAENKRNGMVIFNHPNNRSRYDFFIVSKNATVTSRRITALDVCFITMSHYHYFWKEFSETSKLLSERETESVSEYIWNVNLDNYCKKHSFSTQRGHQIFTKTIRRLKQPLRMEFYKYWENEKLKNPDNIILHKTLSEYGYYSKKYLSRRKYYEDYVSSYLFRLPNEQCTIDKLEEKFGNWTIIDAIVDSENKDLKIVVNPYKRSGLDYFLVDKDIDESTLDLRTLDKRYRFITPYLEFWEEIKQCTDFLSKKEYNCINEFLKRGNLEIYKAKYLITDKTAILHLNKVLKKLMQPESLAIYNEWIQINMLNTFIYKDVNPLEEAEGVLKQIFNSIMNDKYQAFNTYQFSTKVLYLFRVLNIDSWEKLLEHSEEDFKEIDNNAFIQLSEILKKFNYKLKDKLN